MEKGEYKFDEEKFEQAVAAFLLLSEAVGPREFVSALGQFFAMRMSDNRVELSNQLKLLTEAVDVGLKAIDMEMAKIKGDANVQ